MHRLPHRSHAYEHNPNEAENLRLVNNLDDPTRAGTSLPDLTSRHDHHVPYCRRRETMTPPTRNDSTHWRLRTSTRISPLAHPSLTRTSPPTTRLALSVRPRSPARPSHGLDGSTERPHTASTHAPSSTTTTRSRRSAWAAYCCCFNVCVRLVLSVPFQSHHSRAHSINRWINTYPLGQRTVRV